MKVGFYKNNIVFKSNKRVGMANNIREFNRPKILNKDQSIISHNVASFIKPSTSNSSLSPFTTQNYLILVSRHCNPLFLKPDSSSIRSTKSTFPPKPTNTVLQISSSKLTEDKNKMEKHPSFWSHEQQLKRAELEMTRWVFFW